MMRCNLDAAIRAQAEKRKHLELFTKLTGQSHKETTQVSVMTSPSFAILHQALKVLDPEDQRAVSDEIERLNNENER